jgi:hypothetical protein
LEAEGKGVFEVEGVSCADCPDALTHRLAEGRFEAVVAVSVSPDSSLFGRDPHAEDPEALLAEVRALVAQGVLGRKGTLSLQDGALRVEVLSVQPGAAGSLSR